MAAAVYNFVIEQGSDFTIDFIYRDENNNPVDLTNKCIVFQFAYVQSDPEVPVECAKYTLSSQANANYDTDNWSLIADNSGLIRIKIAAELTKNFTPTEANGLSIVYDLDVISQTDNLRNIRLSSGIITIAPRNFSNLITCPTNIDICAQEYSPTGISPTPTPTGLTPTPTVTDSNDLCIPFDCLDLDIYSMVYSGSGLSLSDVSTASDSVTTSATGIIENVELAINGLSHSSPSDLQFLLAPPSGDKILLSANHKIPNYSNSFSFMFSNKAPSGQYLYNCSNGGSINIYNKTDVVNYNNETLLYSFDHLFNNSITGIWTLYVRDTDPLGSGSINSWKLIVTHAPDDEP